MSRRAGNHRFVPQKMSSDTDRPIHAPEMSWGRKVLGDFHVTGIFWYRFHRWAIATLPEWTLAPLIAVFTRLFFLSIWKIRRAIASNLVPVLGPAGFCERQRRLFRTMHEFAWCLTERYERLVTQRPFTVEAEAIEHWRAVADSGGGFVMVTAHIGLYEVGSMMPGSLEDRHVHLVREPEIDARAQAFIKESVASVEGAHYSMHFQTGDPLFAMTLVEALQRGEVVAIQGDRPRTGGKIVEATLFGRPFILPVGPAVLARVANVPMLPVFAIREGRRRFRLVFCPPVTVARSSDRNADLKQATLALAHHIEVAIRRAPHQWFVFRELWPSGARIRAPDR